MKRICATAIALTLAVPAAFAESHVAPGAMTDGMMDRTMYNMDYFAENEGSLIRTRDITGGNVYTTNEANDEGWDNNTVYDAVGADWNQIGEIEDLILNRTGQVIGIVAEVGGFLDIGDTHVIIPVSDLSLVAVDDQTYSYVTRYNEEQLEAMPDVDEGWWD